MEDGQLALHYLGDLRTVVYGRTVGIDLALVYASEAFLRQDWWPTYAKEVGDHGAIVLAEVAHLPLDAPVSLKGGSFLTGAAQPREWAVRLAVFTDETEESARPLLVMPDGRLINWRPGEDDDVVVCLETERASAIMALIARVLAARQGAT